MVRGVTGDQEVIGTTTRGEALQLQETILELMSAPDGFEVWTPSDFAHYAPRAAIDTALHRLSDNEIARVGHGLYHKPRVNSLSGKATVASISGIISAVARKNGVRILVDEMTAANELGWDTAVPSKNIVFTTGRIRDITAGNALIQFKRVSETKLYWAGRPAMRVVQALHYLHDKIDRERADIIRKLDRLLADQTHGKEIELDLREGFRLLPIWMQDFLRPTLFHAKGPDMDREDDPAGPSSEPKL